MQCCQNRRYSQVQCRPRPFPTNAMLCSCCLLLETCAEDAPHLAGPSCIVVTLTWPAFVRIANLNSIERVVQFTVEKEEDGQLPFLDVLVKRSQSMLSFKVYRESTHTGCYLHFHSLHPASHKRSVVASLFHRAYRICTEPEDVKADHRSVRKDFSECGYPLPFVNAVERKLLQPPRSDSSPAAKKCAPVPYMPGINEALARILRSYDSEVSHVPAKKLRQALVNVKYCLPKEKFPGIVYTIPCRDCNHVYMGESGNFVKRLKQHQHDVANKKASSNALAEHSESQQHDVD
ncbi:uncharacterized protein LOC144112913 isoform X1 [Amblyomma americanum]